MANITFKAKLRPLFDMDMNEVDKLIDVPALTRSHCDMAAFRKHPKFGGFANSQLFPGMLARIRRDVTKSGWIRLSDLPENVTVDASKFLAVVTIEV